MKQFGIEKAVKGLKTYDLGIIEVLCVV